MTLLERSYYREGKFIVRYFQTGGAGVMWIFNINRVGMCRATVDPDDSVLEGEKI